jgi:hypothetical protein
MFDSVEADIDRVTGVDDFKMGCHRHTQSVRFLSRRADRFERKPEIYLDRGGPCLDLAAHPPPGFLGA